MQREDIASVDTGVKREKLDLIDLNIPFAVVLSGIRRCGKSTLLKQLIQKREKFYYFNFEDPRAVDFELEDFERLNEIFLEEYGKSNYYFFDEIQNVPKWELFIRAMLDRNKHFFITGSNASLLSKELGTKLTGRHISYELFPFSFKEFLKLKGKKANMKSFKEYFLSGGFPQYLKIEKSEILQELFNDIVNRDVAVRHNIRNVKALRQLALFLISNIGKEFSYNSLKNMFNLGSINSIISFISYFEDSYMIFSVPKFDYSMKKQIINPKKVYSIDNGFSKVNSASFSEDKGKMLENMVFIELRKKFKDIFYFQKTKECDFVVKERTKITQAIQVCYDLNDNNKDREISGLVIALKEFGLDEGKILTYDQEDKITIDKKTVNIVPAWKWMMNN